MSVVGEDFKHNILYVPEVLIAARAMKAGMAVLKPLLSAQRTGDQCRRAFWSWAPCAATCTTSARTSSA